MTDPRFPVHKGMFADYAAIIPIFLTSDSELLFLKETQWISYFLEKRTLYTKEKKFPIFIWKNTSIGRYIGPWPSEVMQKIPFSYLLSHNERYWHYKPLTMLSDHIVTNVSEITSTSSLPGKKHTTLPAVWTFLEHFKGLSENRICLPRIMFQVFHLCKNRYLNYLNY